MKKLLLAILMLVFITSSASADWLVTVSGWTMSPGPDLSYEQVRMDGVAQVGCDNILPADSKSCAFTIASKTGQAITIRSFDISANFADHSVGVIGSGPNPATGGNITIIWQ